MKEWKKELKKEIKREMGEEGEREEGIRGGGLHIDHKYDNIRSHP